MRKRNVTARVLNGFDDPTLDPAQWEKLLSDCQTDIVYLTWEWQRTWWEVFQPGELLLIAVERNGELVAIAPLYVDSGMAYFVGSGFESGYLNFIGETKTGVLDAILGTVCDRFPDLEGFEFYFVPDNSGTGRRLRGAAGRFSLDCYETDRVAGPVLNLASPEIALAATQKKDALQHERMLRREGKLDAGAGVARVDRLRRLPGAVPALRAGGLAPHVVRLIVSVDAGARGAVEGRDSRGGR